MKSIAKHTRQTSSQLKLATLEGNDMIIDEYLKFKPELAIQSLSYDQTGPMNTPQHMRVERKVLR